MCADVRNRLWSSFRHFIVPSPFRERVRVRGLLRTWRNDDQGRVIQWGGLTAFYEYAQNRPF